MQIAEVLDRSGGAYGDPILVDTTGTPVGWFGPDVNTLPVGPQTIGAATFTATATLIPGAITATGSSPIGGATFTTTATLIPGAITATGSAPIGGALFTLTAQLVTGGISIPGQFFPNIIGSSTVTTALAGSSTITTSALIGAGSMRLS